MPNFEMDSNNYASQILIFMLLSVLYCCSGVPLMNMAENTAQDTKPTAAEPVNNSTTDLLASHQDLHPIRVPDDESNLASSEAKTPASLSPVVIGLTVDAMKKELQLERPLDISIVPSVGSPTAVTVPKPVDETTLKPAMTMFHNPNATNYDKLMHNLGVARPNPDAPTIQHKTELGSAPIVLPKGPVIPSVFLASASTTPLAIVAAAPNVPQSLMI
ncbi:hypothetical protein RvY_10827 [Ramazzottius varieornatus]|uniref:Uncharacterized protein n=1 Tax=Ramazzottius varieornatus TaxID=947166 RepID=A0A1D1VG38_RAMVA|nr:hypothetical protein RvY_10827 [Ramazzottius varieornatus]